MGENLLYAEGWQTEIIGPKADKGSVRFPLGQNNKD
jgi:hypothetical protein